MSDGDRWCLNCAQLLRHDAATDTWLHDRRRVDPARRVCGSCPIPTDAPSPERVRAQRNCKRHLMFCMCKAFPDGCGCGPNLWREWTGVPPDYWRQRMPEEGPHSKPRPGERYWDGEKVVEP